MPSHTADSALIKLFFLPSNPGAPWIWPQWQSITGVKHGLFPADDRLLPDGWTRQQADNILAYFNHYNSLDTEANKIKFAAGSRPGPHFPGREEWRNYISRKWEKWKMHDAIIKAFRLHHVHPITLLVSQGSLEQWPNADTYIPLALDSIGLSLFGVESFGGQELLSIDLRKCITIFAQRSWTRIRMKVKADRGRLQLMESTATKAFQCMH